MEESINIEFFGLQIDNHLNWMNHISQMIPKLSSETARLMFHISNTDTLKSICFACFDSIMKYGIIFGG
jgi:hypothetical protein